MKPFVVAMTGASGAVYGKRLLQMLIESERDVYLLISPSAATVLRHELGIDVKLDSFEPLALQLNVAADLLRRIRYYHYQDLLAAPASGSFRTAGMVICPCSSGTLSAVAHGTGGNLIQRAADVHLKEQRRLVVVPRETPLSLIQLDNMKRVCEAGAVVLPAMPGWYHGVDTVDDLVDFVVARILDQLDVPHRLAKRWGASSNLDDSANP